MTPLGKNILKNLKLLALILPCLGYYMVLHKTSHGGIFLRVTCISLIVIGVFVMFFGSVIILTNFGSNSSLPKYYCDSEIQ